MAEDTPMVVEPNTPARKASEVSAGALATPHGDILLDVGVASSTLYDVEAYTFGTKDGRPQKHTTESGRLESIREKFSEEGLRHSVSAVVLCHSHGHPHVFLLQDDNGVFHLPGGKLHPGESDSAGLLRKLRAKLAPPDAEPEWEIQDLLAVWFRPEFDHHMYPYQPPHITKPKEKLRLYLISLPEKCAFAVPRNFRFMAVPLFEIYDNAHRYGHVIASIPNVLSRFNLNCVST